MHQIVLSCWEKLTSVHVLLPNPPTPYTTTQPDCSDAADEASAACGGGRPVVNPVTTARPVSECVANNPEFWCDGEDDCPGGADETGALCDGDGDDTDGSDTGGLQDADFCELVSCSQNGVPEFCPVRCATTSTATPITGSPATSEPTAPPSLPPTTIAPSGEEPNPDPTSFTSTGTTTVTTTPTVESTATTEGEILLDQDGVEASNQGDADAVSTTEMILVLALACLIFGIVSAMLVIREMRLKDEAANCAKIATTNDFGWSDVRNGPVGGPKIWNRGLENDKYDDFAAENDGAQEYFEFADEVLSFPEPSMFDRTPIPSQHHAPGRRVSTIDIDSHTDAAAGANLRSGGMSLIPSEDAHGYLDVAEEEERVSPYGTTEIDVDEHLDESEYDESAAMTTSGVSASRMMYIPRGVVQKRSSDQWPSGSFRGNHQKPIKTISSQWIDALSETSTDEWVPTGIQLTPVAAKGDKRGSQQGARPVQVLPTRRDSHKASSNPAVYATVSRASRNTVSGVARLAKAMIPRT